MIPPFSPRAIDFRADIYNFVNIVSNHLFFLALFSFSNMVLMLVRKLYLLTIFDVILGIKI